MSKCEQCIVRQFNSLKHLSKEELKSMSSCKTSLTVKKGETLFNEGEHLKGVYCIKEGTCKVSKISENGRDQIVNLVQKGNLIGQRSLISEETSNLKAVALNDMQVCFIPKDEIIKDIEKNNALTMGLLKNMVTSLKKAENSIVDMAQKTVRQRLAKMLLYLHSNFNTDANGYIVIQLSREEIANIIGTATESAIRILSEFKKKGVIDFKLKAIRIIDADEIEKIKQGF